MTKRVTSIGGQALLEGIMMVGPKKNTAAFCDEAGNITTEDITAPSLREKYPILKKPFLRGVFAMIDTMRLGLKALTLSAEKAGLEDEEAESESKFDRWLSEKFGDKVMNAVVAIGSVLGVALAVVLFFFLPTMLFNGLESLLGTWIGGWRSVFEGLLRILIFVGYIVLVSRMKEIDRTFRYHGAEHKTIFCYEKGLELTVENVRVQPKHHPRCGTSFLFVVIVVSILLSSIVFSFWQFTNPWLRTLVHLALLPAVVGLTWEINRYVGGHDSLLCRAIRRPGMAIQRWTTFEPDDSMIEVGIEALKQVLPEEKGKDQW